MDDRIVSVGARRVIRAVDSPVGPAGNAPSFAPGTGSGVATSGAPRRDDDGAPADSLPAVWLCPSRAGVVPVCNVALRADARALASSMSRITSQYPFSTTQLPPPPPPLSCHDPSFASPVRVPVASSARGWWCDSCCPALNNIQPVGASPPETEARLISSPTLSLVVFGGCERAAAAGIVVVVGALASPPRPKSSVYHTCATLTLGWGCARGL